MKMNSSTFDNIVASYYPAVYSFASRLTDNPLEATALTRDAFNRGRKRVIRLRDQNAIATVLLSSVIRAGLTAA